MLITSHHLKEQVSSQLATLDELKTIPESALREKPAPNKWSVLEVIAHMELTMQLYLPKFETAWKILDNSPSANDSWESRMLAGYFIKSIAPKKDNRISFKMKTAGSFKPETLEEENGGLDRKLVFEKITASLNYLNECIDKMRSHNVASYKVNSALGVLVRFTLPEATAFLLGHNERHFQQVENTIQAIKAYN